MTTADAPLAGTPLGAFPPVHRFGDVPACAAGALADVLSVHGLCGGAVSARFLYWASRELAGRAGRPGTRVTDCVTAWERLGLVDEQAWPWDPAAVDEPPDPRVLRAAAAAPRPQTVRAHWRPDLRTELTVELVTVLTAAGVPVVLDVPLHPVQASSFGDGVFAVPPDGARPVGRHVVVATGPAPRASGSPDAGADLAVRNTWGPDWGDGGNGVLPSAHLAGGWIRQIWFMVSQWSAPLVPECLPGIGPVALEGSHVVVGVG